MRVLDRFQFRSIALVGAVALSVLFAQCNKAPTTPSPGSQPPVPGPNPTPPLPQASGPVVFVGAGDIAIPSGHDDATARLIDLIPGDVFTLGDDAYPNGSAENFKVFDRTWGRFAGFIHPAPGNHEYMTAGASGYFGYFGQAAGPAGLGYYSFDLGSWHLISLNSNYEYGVAVDAGSPQAAWLQSDLAKNATVKCTLAYWHHPLFSSGQNGSYQGMKPIFDILYNAGAEIVLNGHDHLYERFGPQTGDGRPDPARGIRQFIVGTGGVNADYRFITTRPNSDKQINGVNGVLKLTLFPDSYQWEFVTAPNGSVADSGNGSCH